MLYGLSGCSASRKLFSRCILGLAVTFGGMLVGCAGGSDSGNSKSSSRESIENTSSNDISAATDSQVPGGGCYLRVMHVDPTAAATQITVDGQELASNLEFSFDTGYSLGANSPLRLVARPLNGAGELDLKLPCSPGVYQTAFISPSRGFSTSVLDATAPPANGKFQARFLNLSSLYPSLSLSIQSAVGSNADVGDSVAVEMELERGVSTEYREFEDLSFPYTVFSQGREMMSAVEIPCFGEENCTVTFLDSTEPGQLVSVVIADGKSGSVNERHAMSR